jgi:2-desacetyl-2-hydroxyethyl bacteriochlorophyllide A dehydrogenase
VLVTTLVSGISPGTELLIYRGQAPADLAVDETIAALAGDFTFPLKYGYALVGRVAALGPGVAADWHGRLVFAFHPHESAFLAEPAALLPLPASLAPDEAVLLPTMETAVNFLLDGQPLIGEEVVVFGQGVVGLLTAALLARLPLARLVTVDRWPARRQWSLALGAHASLDPDDPAAPWRSGAGGAGADLVYELSGDPRALDLAIATAGYAGRVVIGSWYGRKRADLDLGGRFHRGKLRLIASQVSRIAPEHSGRWTTGRRLAVAWRMLAEVRPARLITHRFPFARAADAYALLDQRPAGAVQVLLEYNPA